MIWQGKNLTKYAIRCTAMQKYAAVANDVGCVLLACRDSNVLVGVDAKYALTKGATVFY
tara:strand:- start:273 stop:449 length:177 start_codon:yes stop_codon:yes gene_type:complete